MILKYGSKSNSKQAVRALSLLLGLGKLDTYTWKLRTAVRQFQTDHGLKVDSIAGPETLGCLAKTLPTVEYMDYSGSKYVKAVQALVSSSIDGKYGKNTRANVIAFQATSGLPQTGNVGTNDWLALFGCEYSKSETSPAPAPAKPTDPASPSKTVSLGMNQPMDYKQGDSRWKTILYTITGSASQTIGSSGCGPTSMADIMASWVDHSITPVEMCAYAKKHGYRTKDSGTAWDFFKSIATAYGFTNFVQTKSMATARAAIKEGALVVASMGPGYWTSGGHFICLWKTDDTYMYACDPASSTRKKQKLGPFEEQRKQFFIFRRPPQIIDISKHQGSIDFDALKSAAALVIVRASCGSDKDIRFDEYARNMVQRNIPFGVYCYSYARDATKGEDEARKIVQYASAYNPLFYCIDAEESCITQAGVKAFDKTLRDLGVKRVGAYVAHHRYKEYGFGSLRSLFDFIWIPRYKSTDDGMATGTVPSFECDLWQYSSNGVVPGINGRVDMNIITGTGHDLKWFLERSDAA
ncbi:MAG: peptidoglycan-binding protein [Bacteroidales bacterium]|nr:peptidoglycan-binding protein [Bacteroidales bacterium]